MTEAPSAPRAGALDTWGLAGMAVVMLAGAVGALVVGGFVIPQISIIPHLLIFAIGAFIVLRTGPENRRLGWLLAASGGFTLQFLGAALAAQGVDSTPAVVVDALGGMFLIPLIAATILYPTGRPASRVLAVLVGFDVVGVTAASTHWLGVTLGWWATGVDPLQLAITLSTIPLFLSFFEQARIFRRRPPLQRQQMKWYLLGLFAAPLYAIPGALGWSDEAFAVTDAFVTLLFPLAILLGITRYKLFEVDRFISRTVGYAVVIATLGALFLGGVALLTTFLPAQDDLAVAATTVVVVALFDPVRRRVQQGVDRRFDRTRYAAQQVVAAFGRAVRDETDVDAVRARLGSVVAETLAPRSVAIWEPPARSQR